MLVFALAAAACDAPADTREAADPAPTTASVQLPSAAPTPEAAATPAPAAAADRDVQVALYHATDGPNWVTNTNWLSEAPLGEWHGVTTDASGRVTELWLPGNQLGGTIPHELGSLSDL